MKIFTALFLLIATDVCAAQDTLNASLQKLALIREGKNRSTDAEYLEASSQALQLWRAASPDEKEAVSHRMALIHFRRAELMADSGNFKAAASELSDEATMQKAFGGRIEFATKSPDAFFSALVELQAQLTAETGSDPLANQVGYSFEKEGDDFTAARLELGDDVAGITVPEMNSGEALALVHRVSRQGGRFVASAPKWFVVPKGRLPDVLKQAKREVAFDSTGKMVLRTLQTGSGSGAASTTTNVDSGKDPAQVLPVVQPPAPKKPTEPKPATQVEEPASSTRWPFVTMVLVAALGLLWMLLKKRK